MSSSSPQPVAPTGARGPFRRKRRLLWLLLPLLLLVGIWYRCFRGTGWSQTFNLMSWYRRRNGEDLYRAGDAFLIRGNHLLPEVALTFDDGPHPASRARILDTLRRFGVHATFFDVGTNMAQHPALVTRTLAEGHEIANHSYHHLRLDGLSNAERHRELNDTDILFYSLTGKHLALMRPPGMRYNDAVLVETHRLGYVVVAYTSASGDFNTSEAPEQIDERTLRRVQNGSILLLHDYPATAQALPGLLDALKQRGFRCVTVSEMLAHLPEPVGASARDFLRSNAP